MGKVNKRSDKSTRDTCELRLHDINQNASTKAPQITYMSFTSKLPTHDSFR